MLRWRDDLLGSAGSSMGRLGRGISAVVFGVFEFVFGDREQQRFPPLGFGLFHQRLGHDNLGAFDAKQIPARRRVGG